MNGEIDKLLLTELRALGVVVRAITRAITRAIAVESSVRMIGDPPRLPCFLATTATSTFFKTVFACLALAVKSPSFVKKLSMSQFHIAQASPMMYLLSLARDASLRRGCSDIPEIDCKGHVIAFLLVV